MGNNDLALSGLLMLAHYHRLAPNPEQLKHQFDIYGEWLTQTNWLLTTKSLGLKAKVLKKPVERLPFVHLPAMV